MKLENSQIQVLSQQQALSQQQTLGMQQLLTVRLTELPLDALQEKVEIECLENPWLEKKQEEDTDAAQAGGDAQGEDDTAYDYRSEDDIPDYMLRQNNGTPATADNIEYADTPSFHDKLKDQMAEYDLTPHERELLEYLIGSLEDDGLLKKPLATIADEAEIYHGLRTDVPELERVLRVLWQFDPAGIGARSLRECLLLQVDRDPHNPSAALIRQVLEKCYEEFIHSKWNIIQEELNMTDQQTERVRAEIAKLNPKPGEALNESAGSAMQHVTPDFIVETDSYGHITMTVNQGNLPELVISADATDRLEAYERDKDKELSKSIQEDMRFMRQYVERGRMFIKALAMRRESMTLTMKAIIRLQRPFFLEGNETLVKPMRLEDVAGLTGYNISTISRVCSGKYVQTNFGTYPLKWFFTQKATRKAGAEAVSSRQMMAMVKELIADEDPADRLSDDRLVKMLKEKGYTLARRTVAKYRELMQIPSSRDRR